MPPKKKGDHEEPPPLIGRVGTSLKIGIVGIPNVGKSTFFNVLTKSEANAENYPFCTIDPNESRVPVPDERYDFLVDHFKPASKVPAFLNVVDIAGLVKGASEGAGLGNAFLSHIKGCDAIYHMTRAFEDEEITHVEGEINPVRDMEIIHEELRLKDEVKAWPIQKGTKAPQAAGKIHTDMERGFIMADVMKFADFKEEGNEAACKAAGKYRQQGRNYIVDDGDILLIKFNAGAGLSAKKK